MTPAVPDDLPALSHARLERALTVAARIVVRHGAAYLPIFERLEREERRARTQSDALARARAIAGAGQRSAAL